MELNNVFCDMYSILDTEPLQSGVVIDNKLTLSEDSTVEIGDKVYPSHYFALYWEKIMNMNV